MNIKIILSILGLIIVGTAAYVTKGPASVPPATESGAAPHAITMDTHETTNQTTTTTANDIYSTADNFETGTDLGMEYPIPDEPSAPPVRAPAGEAKIFSIKGKNFTYDVTEIRVKQGDTVTINFESVSGFHDWVIDEFSAQTATVRDGETTSVTFVADKIGTFEYYCSVGSHRANGMVGKLIVE